MSIQNFPAHLAYYRNLHLPLTVKAIGHRFKGQSIVYGIKCRTTNMIYIGSTSSSLERFFWHLEAQHQHHHSNQDLQKAIVKYGLESFTMYVFISLAVDPSLSKQQQSAALKGIEQKYIDMFPKFLLYNRINSVANT